MTALTPPHPPQHPVVIRLNRERAADFELRLADPIAFVMIGQNRQGAFQQAKADHDFVEGEQELKLNTDLTREIHELARELHERVLGTPGQERLEQR